MEHGEASPSTRCAIVAVVPARGGSKGLPGKNLRHVRGRSLVRRAVEVASGLVDEVVVSSDSAAVLAEAQACGATPLQRPDSLATDEASTVDVVAHVLGVRPRADVV